MDWNTYYERFFDWANSTQISRISQLTSFGPSDEVTEVAQELMDRTAASRLIRKALDAGVVFTAENICELMDCCDKALMNRLVAAADCRFTQDQLEELWEPEPAPAPAPKLSFWAALGLSSLFRRTKPAHGRCSGDCAHCPPHYGYRYGRWYYGHGHSHGCEFGGNRGDGRD